MSFSDLVKPHRKQLIALLPVVVVVILVRFAVVQYLQRTGSVTLAWDPSPRSGTCPAEFGYNLYRGEHSGSYSARPINKQLIEKPIYTDTSVVTGKTYYYVVKAKCGNIESEPSNEMKVDVREKTKKEK